MEFRILLFERKELRFFEPVEEMCGQVVAREKEMNTCRPVRSLKDYALSLHSFLTPPQTGYIVSGDARI